MIKFGPAGNSDIFYDQGYKSSLDMPEWLKNMGLDAYEYSFTRGVRLNVNTAEKLGKKALDNDITVSVHAPYYINLANYADEAKVKNERYIVESCEAASWMGAERVIFHPGAVGKQTRQNAMNTVKNNLLEIMNKIVQKNIKITLCPETAGKIYQVGTLTEILELCLLDDMLVPAIDFAHVHAYTGGGLKSKKNFDDIFNENIAILGLERSKKIHIHFSRVEFTEKNGEKKHWRLKDIQYGPEFSLLADSMMQYDVNATIICESHGTMAEDAAEMKKIYQEYNNTYMAQAK